MSTETIRNWDKTQTFTPIEVHHPDDEDEIVGIIRRAQDRKQRVKPVGSALSWSDIIDMPGHALRFDRMARISVNRDRKTVTVGAGALLKDVNEALAQHGLAFENFGSIILQTAAGYIGTGTHGTGGRSKLLSTYIERMRLIDGQGELHELDKEREPELFSAARVNLGCLGVVTEITFRCVDAFDLEERLELMPFDRLLADLGRMVADNDYLKLWWLPYNDHVQVYRFNRTDTPRTGFNFTRWMDQSGLSVKTFTGVLAMSRTLPRITPVMNKIVQSIHFKPHIWVDRSDRVIRYDSIPLHQESEYAFPIQEAPRIIEEIRRMVLRGSYRVNFPMEVRFVAADDIPMSPASGRDSCYVGAYVASVPWAKLYHAGFEELMADVAGRPHWGKSFTRSPEQLRKLYPAYDEFDRLRRRCDPDGLFRNSFVDRVFKL